MRTLALPTHTLLLIIKMDSTKSMDKALAELREQDLPNFSAVAEKHDLVRSTLTRHFYGQTTSRDDPTNVGNRCLTKH